MEKAFISYSDAIHLFSNNYISIPIKLVNDYESHLLMDFDNFDLTTEYNSVFLSDIVDQQTVAVLTDLFPDVHIKYFELLEGWCLFVQHSGTSWKAYDIAVNTKSKWFERIFFEGSSSYEKLKF